MCTCWDMIDDTVRVAHIDTALMLAFALVLGGIACDPALRAASLSFKTCARFAYPGWHLESHEQEFEAVLTAKRVLKEIQAGEAEGPPLSIADLRLLYSAFTKVCKVCVGVGERRQLRLEFSIHDLHEVGAHVLA